MRYETVRDENGVWRLHMIAVNGDVTIRPEPYKTREDCEFMIDLYKKAKAQKVKAAKAKTTWWGRMSNLIWGSEE